MVCPTSSAGSQSSGADLVSKVAVASSSGGTRIGFDRTLGKAPRPVSFRTSCRRRRGRAALAGLACALLALIALPGLHLVGHQDDHEHLPGGGIRPRTLAEVAGFPEDEADEARDDQGPDRGQGVAHRHPRTPSSHGAGAAAHLAAALVGMPALPELPAPHALRLAPSDLTSESPAGVPSLAAQARGPPRAAS